MTTPEDRARQLRHRHERERQAVVFGTLLSAMGVVGLVAAAVYFSGFQLPFLARDFSTPTPTETTAAVTPWPCLADGTMPVAYADVQVSVLNGTARSGLAATTADELTLRGFTVTGTGNAPSYPGVAEITTGAAGVAGAYTLAANLGPGVTVSVDARGDATLTLTLGAQWVGMVDTAEVGIDPAQPMASAEGCEPAEDLIAALPATTPTETPVEG